VDSSGSELGILKKTIEDVVRDAQQTVAMLLPIYGDPKINERLNGLADGWGLGSRGTALLKCGGFGLKYGVYAFSVYDMLSQW